MREFLDTLFPGLIPATKEERLAREILTALKHLPGQHNQLSHGGTDGMAMAPDKGGGEGGGDDWMSMLMSPQTSEDEILGNLREEHAESIKIIDNNLNTLPTSIKNADDWASRSYQEAGKRIEVGEGSSMSAGYINEKRRNERVRMYRGQVKESADTMVRMRKRIPSELHPEINQKVADTIKSSMSSPTTRIFLDAIKIGSQQFYNDIIGLIGVNS